MGAVDDVKENDRIEAVGGDYKGSVGTVVKMTEQKVTVKFDGDDTPRTISKASIKKAEARPTPTPLKKPSKPDPDAAAPSSLKRLGTGAALGAVVGGVLGGPMGAAAGAALGATVAKGTSKYSEYTYKNLQASAKRLNVNAVGKTEELRARVEEAAAKAAPAASADSPPATDKAAKGKKKAEAPVTPSGSLASKLDQAAKAVMPAVTTTMGKGEEGHAQEIKAKTLKVKLMACTGPLFSDGKGPQPGEVHQGDIGDCYFCASLILLSGYAPEAIRDAIVEKKGPDGSRRFEVSFRKNKVARAGKFPVVDTMVTVTVDDTFNVDVTNGDAKAEMLYIGTGLGGSGKASLTGCIWPGVMEKAWAAFLAETEGESPSYDLIQAIEENPLQRKCTIDSVCAAVAGWAFDSSDQVTAKHVEDLRKHVAQGQPASIGTGNDTKGLMAANKLYGHHQYAVMGVQKDKDGDDCFRARNPHNKFKGKGPVPLHRGKSAPKEVLYIRDDGTKKLTTEFLLPLKDTAEVLSTKGCSIITLTMPE